jgi:hypothetical protein
MLNAQSIDDMIVGLEAVIAAQGCDEQLPV